MGRDGCCSYGGVRARCALGHGDGSLRDEFARGVRAPLAGDGARDGVLACGARDPGLAAFVHALPVASLEGDRG